MNFLTSNISNTLKWLLMKVNSRDCNVLFCEIFRILKTDIHYKSIKILLTVQVKVCIIMFEYK